MKIAHAAGLPVPQVLGEPLILGGRETFFMEYVAGETIGSRLLRDAAFAVARSHLPAQAVQALVKIHRVDGRVLDWLPQPKTTLDLVASLEQDLDALSEGRPALELGLRWLRLNAPPLEHTTLVHGDFRIGNLVVGPEGLRSVLDWELSHLGDPTEDLGWFCVRAWRFGCDQFPAGGITTREELLRLYRAAGGHQVCPERLRYWELFGNVKWGIVALSQAARYVRGETSNFELAVVGRLSCETEWEILRLLSEFER
jgi:aminoglycoside phosphotransferase (APT) family kinase protein